MPPETPTTTVRPLSMDHLLLLRRELLVRERHFAVEYALERHRGHLAGQRLTAALGPVVQPPRFPRGHDRELVFVAARGRKQRSQFGHAVHLLDSSRPP